VDGLGHLAAQSATGGQIRRGGLPLGLDPLGHHGDAGTLEMLLSTGPHFLLVAGRRRLALLLRAQGSEISR